MPITKTKQFSITVGVVSGEILIAAVESVTFYLIAVRIEFRYAVLASCAANAASYMVGLV